MLFTSASAIGRWNSSISTAMRAGFQLRRIEHLIHQRFQMLARLVDIDGPFRQLILVAHARLHLDQLAIA